MKRFLYKAKGPNGKIITGTVEAKDELEAESLLLRHSLVATDIVASQSSSYHLFEKYFFRVNSKDKAVFARQLATMISAGLTLPKSIKIASTQARNERLRGIYLDVFRCLEEGQSFSTSLSKHPEAFDQVFISVVNAGESTGKLDIVLKQLADQLESDNNFIAKVKGAMYYPAFILCALIGVAIYMLAKVIPSLKSIFDQQGANLPIATRALLATSEFVEVYWWAVILILVGLIVFSKFFFESNPGANVKDQLQIRIPAVKKLYEGIYMYRMTKVLAMLLGAGVPLLNALKIAASTMSNAVYEESLLDVTKYVERGVPLSTQLLKEPVFPQLVGQMAAVGEETGELDGVMNKVSDYYQENTEQMIKTLATLIEPVVLIFIGCGVAFLVFAVMIPIYNVAQVQ